MAKLAFGSAHYWMHLCWTDIKRVTDPRSKARHEIVNKHFPHLKIGYAMRISCKFEEDSFDFVMFFSIQMTVVHPASKQGFLTDSGKYKQDQKEHLMRLML